MSTQVQQHQNYNFSAEPQPVGYRKKYNDQNNDSISKEKIRAEANEDDVIQQFTNANNNYEDINDIQLADEKKLVPDYYIDKPPSPEFKPKEKGVEVHTQIIDNELFDYVLEVEPILQVLVGKTVDQARMELIEEFEQIEFLKHKAKYEIKRNAELMVTQRMEAAHIRRQEEKERRNWQHKLNRDQQKHIHKKLISRILIKRALSNVKPNSLNDLQNLGYLSDQTIRKIKANYYPLVMGNAIDLIHNNNQQHHNVDQLLNNIQQKTQNTHKNYLEKERKRKQDILDERERQRIKKEIRKRKKNEWKRKMAINQARQKILDQIFEHIINKAEKVEQIQNCEFTDITGDNKKGNIIPVFGGLVGQIWTAIQSYNRNLHERLNANNIVDIVNSFLQHLKNPITIRLNENEKQFYDDLVKDLESKTENLNEERAQFVQALLDNEQLYLFQNTTIDFIRYNILQQEIELEELKQIYRVFFNNLSNNIKPDASDGEDKHFKAKMAFIFDNLDSQIQENINVVLNIRIPFLSEEEIQAEKLKQEELEKKNPSHQQIDQQQPTQQSQEQIQQQEEQNQQEAQEQQQQEEEEQKVEDNKENEEKKQEEEEEKCKYDEFVDIFDGQGYSRDLEQLLINSRRVSLTEDFPAAFNILQSEERKILCLDEREAEFLIVFMFQTIKEVLGNKHEQITFQQFQELFKQLNTMVNSDFIKTIFEEEKLSQIPIFDVDYYFV